jgi:hypothetical protein
MPYTASLSASERTTIFSLNDDVLKIILSKSEIPLRMNLRSVCSRFKSIIDQEVKAVYFLKVPNAKDLTFLKKFKSLKELDFNGLEVTDKYVSFIDNELPIEFLNFSRCSLITSNT